MEPSLPAEEASVVNALVKAARAGDFAAAHALIDKAEEYQKPAILELLAQGPTLPAKERRRGIVRVSFELLAAVLRFPRGTRITGFTEDLFRDQILFRVEHDSLPAIDPGHVLPELRCVYDTDRDSFRWEW